MLADDGEFSTLKGFTALEHLGDSYLEDNPVLAENYYRRLLAENPSLKSTTATQHIKLAELPFNAVMNPTSKKRRRYGSNGRSVGINADNDFG